MAGVIKGKDILIENVTTLPTGPNKWDGRTVDLWASGTVGTGYPERMIWKESASAWFSVVPQGSVTPDKLSVPSGPTLPLPDECYDGMLFDVEINTTTTWDYSTAFKIRYLCSVAGEYNGNYTFQFRALSGNIGDVEIYHSTFGTDAMAFFPIPIDKDVFDYPDYYVHADAIINYTFSHRNSDFDPAIGIKRTELVEGYGVNTLYISPTYNYTEYVSLESDFFYEGTSSYPGEIAAGVRIDGSTGSYIHTHISVSLPSVVYFLQSPG